MIGAKNEDAEFPSKKVFQRLGSKVQLVTNVLEYCHGRDGYHDISALCSTVIVKPDAAKSDDDKISELVGEVYFLKSGPDYKISKTYDTVRQGSEIRIQLPEKVRLVHSIKTDDLSGIESYWHKRFESKRMNVRFRQACMHFGEAVGIDGRSLIHSGRTTADENQNDILILFTQPTGASSVPFRALA